jgi:3-oxoacyl-[acyl-carrier-protein] synthase-3
VRFTDLSLAGVTSWLPPEQTIDDAERSGAVTRRLLWRTEFQAVRAAGEESGPEMAARAAVAAIRRAGVRADDVALVLHACAWYQGHDMWAPASYVQRVALGNDSPAIEVRQMSNGGLAALELAASYLAADDSRRHALITTGDRFAGPGFDRWRSDAGTAYGDGGTAVVLTRHGGPLRLRALVTVADAALEGMHRGDDRFADAPLTARRPVDLEPPRRVFVADNGLDTVLDRMDRGQRSAVKRCLSDAGLELADIDWFVLPHLGRPRLTAHFLGPLGIDVASTTWSWGRRIGHLGAGDQFAGLAQLVSSGTLRPGQRCLLIGVGGGFTWSCAVVEMDAGAGDG